MPVYILFSYVLWYGVIFAYYILADDYQSRYQSGDMFMYTMIGIAAPIGLPIVCIGLFFVYVMPYIRYRIRKFIGKES